ncbi:Fic/DOC family protein [Metamycoplasma subdolum]|uniref:Fic/DOC family protein n=1 Tax=Metamycoplasma subdolum TaxID=92407 RepID=A0A3M0A8H8_9BACT|nr:Fic family protein [Metamycoplasma subdolum]RMA79108.1 Fic/DOC family protein [Metamycoplasma subdolum]WPB50631.1 Fic family protein [Metamycoplasma subdolum]
MAENYITIRNEINSITETIESLVHGSIEIRQTNNKKFIYVHFRTSGRLQTKYVGEFSDELFNLIQRNNLKVRVLKKRLKELRKRTDSLNYKPKNLNEKVKLNIDLASRNLVDSIYKQSKLEGIFITYAQIKTLLNGGRVNDMNALDVQKILNLKHAWEFILDKDVITYPSNFSILCQINALVQESISYDAGKIRKVAVTISGSTYLPPLPFENQIKENIETIIKNKSFSDVEKAARLISYLMKVQTFLDGNKRTAVIFGNHFLISKGLGIIVVPVDKLDEYRDLLLEYYENKSEKIINFLIENCYLELNQ